jgi:hypothetical protein
MKVRESLIQEEVDNRQKYFLDRAQRQNNKEQTINAIKKYKNDEFKMGKTQTIQNDSYKKEFMQAVQMHNEDKYKKVRGEEDERAMKMRNYEENKLKETKDAYSERVENERLRILDHEMQIKKMEKLEAELLGRLKNSQQLEQAEYSILETALKESNEACLERKRNQTKIRKPRPKEVTNARHSMSQHNTEQSSEHQL